MDLEEAVTTVAKVRLWGREIAAVSLEEGQTTARFQYVPEFAATPFQVAPLKMPLSERIYEFPELPANTFHGLPGLLADSLPDRFGSLLIDRWLAMQGRRPESFNAIERLCYTGSRGMGALEFSPVSGPRRRTARRIEIDGLVQLASEVLTQRERYAGSFEVPHTKKALEDLLLVGTSAGGARAKAVIAWNPDTNEVRSGQVAAGPGFGYWLLKFDGVSGNRDKELEDPQGFGVIEYAYHRMAVAAGLRMSECRLLEENGRRHFMTRRFDRLDDGGKLHMQSLCAMAHFDFNQAGAYGYEQAFMAMRQLGLPVPALEEQFRRMVFNLVARNQDDHVKNIAFLMDPTGRWSLAPAFDVVYSYNPTGPWTSQHQMSMSGKRDGFVHSDFVEAGKAALLKQGRAGEILAQVTEVVRRWPEFAAEAGVPDRDTARIAAAHRLDIDRRA